MRPGRQSEMPVVERSLVSQAWWHMSVVTTLRRLRQEDCELEASLGYSVGREDKGNEGRRCDNMSDRKSSPDKDQR